MENASKSETEELSEKYKECVLNILKDFHDFLEKHGIRYSLAYGTLLGAIRHNGFIPWDDDIDIILSVAEFQKLLKVVDEFNNDSYLVVKPFDDGPCACPIGIKIYYKRACILENHCSYYNGPYIDVFSTLEVKNPKRVKSFAYRYSFNYMMLLIKNKRSNKKNVSFPRRYVGLLFALARLTPKRHIKKVLTQYFERNNGAEYVISSFGSRVLFKREWFKKYTSHKFEQYEFSIIENYDALLSACYGDYMRLPPVEERRPSHVRYLSFEESFLDKNKEIEASKQRTGI